MNNCISPNWIPKVSVIVPVYNTELYVERAIISLMEQTLDDVQFIIIDDGSKDNSLTIIKQVVARYPGREAQVTLISRENRGVAATRAQGMDLVTGDYVIHLDSDDWAERNWLEVMYTKAINGNADVVVCDYYTVFRNRQSIFKQDVPKNNIDCVKNLLLSKISNSNCDKLVKRTIFSENNINFHVGYDMGEDFLVTFLILCNSNIIIHHSDGLYFYNKCNEFSLTRTYSNKALEDIVNVVSFVDDYINEMKLNVSLAKEVTDLKLSVKALLIVHSHGDLDAVNYALKIYDSANEFIFSSRFKILKYVYFLEKTNLLIFFPLVFLLRDFWSKIR